MKKCICVLTALLMLLMLPMNAYAHEAVQTDKTDCSIRVLVRYDGETVSGGTLTAVRIGYVREDNGDYSFCRVKDDAALEELQSPETVKDLVDFYRNNKNSYAFDYMTVTVEKGVAEFRDLSTGLYLILQEKEAPGFEKLNAFLVSVPYLVDGEYVYDVTAASKTGLKMEVETQPPTEPPTTEPEDKLPQTGQLNWPVPVLAVLGLALCVGGYALSRKKEE